MEERNQINTMLQLLPQPAFLVEEGMISHVNQAAKGYLLQPGQPFGAMLLSGGAEYAEFTGGSLYVTLSVGGQSFGACVTRVDAGDIVTLEPAAEQPQLQSLALAAKALREPLSGMLSLAELFLPAAAQENETLQAQAAQMNRRLYQLLRIVGNMSDAPGYAHAGRMECVELCNFLEEILEKTAAVTEQTGIRLTYELPREPIFTMADPEKLERAVYNLLSNAIKFAPEGAAVRARLVHKNKRVYFSVINSAGSTEAPVDPFSRFLREPALEDRRNGIGLGMVLVRATAALHGGAVLVDSTEGGTRITMTLQVRRTDGNQVHSPVMRFDYAGEHDHCLMELADVLPPSAYGVEQMK